MIDWHNYQTILLDMDGTLLDLHYDNFFWNEYLPEHYARLNGLPLATSKKMLREQFDSKRGQLAFYSTDYWSNVLDIDLMPVKAQLKQRIRFLPGAVDLLSMLSNLPAEVLLVTNAHNQTLDLKHAAIGIKDHVDKAYVSHDFGRPKEDPTFWKRLHQRHSFDPSTTLLIDDNQAVLQSASQFAINTLILPLKPDSTEPEQAVTEDNDFLTIHSLTDLLTRQ